jgi:transposase
MRRRQLKWLWKRLAQLREMKLKRDSLLLKLGAAPQQAPRAWRLVEVEVPTNGSKLTYRLGKEALRAVRRREGHYLLRTNLAQREPSKIWEFYTLLTQIEEAFKNLKGDLAIRPIFHQKEPRIEVHIMVAFLAYCLHVTLRHKLRYHAPGLTPRAVLEKFATIQMLDAWFPTTDGRWLIFARYTQPEKDHRLLLDKLDLRLPTQSPPRITAQGKLTAPDRLL